MPSRRPLATNRRRRGRRQPRRARVSVATDPDLSAPLRRVRAPRVARGVTLGVINNVDVAPTMAELFGLTLENADGRVLKEILMPRVSDGES